MICCAVHSAVGCSVTLKCNTRRRARTTKTNNTFNCSGDSEEIDGDQLTDVVRQKSFPCLAWFFASLGHQTGDGTLGDFETEFEEFSVDSRCAPEGLAVAMVRTNFR